MQRSDLFLNQQYKDLCSQHNVSLNGTFNQDNNSINFKKLINVVNGVSRWHKTAKIFGSFDSDA